MFLLRNISESEAETWTWAAQRGPNMQKRKRKKKKLLLPVMERFKWHAVHRAHAHTRTQDHTCFLVWRASQKRQKPVASSLRRAAGVVFDILHLKARWPDEGETHRYGSRPCGLLWELHLQNVFSAFYSLYLDCLRDFLFFFFWRWPEGVQDLEKQLGLPAGQVHLNRTRSPTRTHASVFSATLSPCVCCSLLSSGLESSADCSSGLSALYERCFCG